MHPVLLICTGACLGALARWRLGLWLGSGLLPWGTLAANLAGGFLVGAVVGGLQRAPALDPALRLALVTGFLGALTTFSTFSIETVALLQAERWAAAAGNVLLHVAGSLALTWLGLQTVAVLARHWGAVPA